MSEGGPLDPRPLFYLQQNGGLHVGYVPRITAQRSAHTSPLMGMLWCGQRKRDWCACPPVPRSLLLVQHRHHAWSLYLNIPKDEVLLVFDRSDLYAAAKYERRDEHNANSYCFHWQTSYWGLAYPCGNHHLHESVIVERTNLHWLRPFKHPLR